MRKWKDPLEEAEERREREKQRQERGAGPPGENRDHYDRPSWSEIDKRREKGGSGGGRPSGSGDGMASLGLVNRRNPAAQKNYRAMLDKAFSGGNLGAVLGKDKLAPLKPGDDAGAALRQKILEAIGADQATEALEAYLASGRTLPADDLDLLGAAAQAGDEALLAPVLVALVALARKGPLKRVAALRQRAKFLADQARDDRVKALAGELVAAIG